MTRALSYSRCRSSNCANAENTFSVRSDSGSSSMARSYSARARGTCTSE